MAEGGGPDKVDGAQSTASEARLDPHPVGSIFISYASQDAAIANAVVAALERQGLHCWIAPRDVTPGAHYADEIIRSINGARALVLVLSRSAIESPHVGREIERAASKGRAIITLKIDAAPMTTALEYFLSESQWIDLTSDGTEAAFAKVLAAVRHQMTRDPAAGSAGQCGEMHSGADQSTHYSVTLRAHRWPSVMTIALSLAAVLIGVGLAVILHGAFSSRDVVVEPFEVPAVLSEQGETGTVVASGVLDELIKLQNATRISAALAASAGVASAKRGLSNAWSNKIRLTTPEARSSFGDLLQLVENHFGHDIHISGSLVETATGGLVLTIRGDGVPPRSIAGRAEGLTALSTAAAEYIYAQSQPALWAKYLMTHERYAEVIALAKDAITNGEQVNRPYFLTFWADALTNSGGSKPDALRLLREALSLKPDYWTPYMKLAELAIASGDEEGAWQVGEQLHKVAGGRPGRAPEAAFIEWYALTWDLADQLAAIESDADLFGGLGTVEDEVAQIQALRHDPDAAMLALNTIDVQSGGPDAVAGTHWVRALLAFDADDAAAAVAEFEAFEASLNDPGVADDFAPQRCWIAPADEAAGRTDRADAALKAAGTFVDCYRFRGDILDHRGDWAAAQKAYGEAVALAPDLPAAYYSWGVALVRHGDLTGAEAKLMYANQRGPHWADPLKAWGDVLAKQGRPKEASAKYDEALKYAPNWKQLKEAREAVAKQKS